jgi:hypothetical protein
MFDYSGNFLLTIEKTYDSIKIEFPYQSLLPSFVSYQPLQLSILLPSVCNFGLKHVRSDRIAPALFATDGAVAAQTKSSHPAHLLPLDLHQIHRVQILGARMDAR